MSTTPPTPDTRTYNRKLLDQVRAMLLGKTLDDVAMYKIGTRELTKIPIAELTKLEAQLEKRVSNEMRRAAGKPRRSPSITFGGC